MAPKCADTQDLPITSK